MPDSREAWDALYDRLCASLAEVGRSDALGRGDFWIVDDDWGGHHQKICLSNPTIWSADLEARIRAVLIDDFSDWGVYVVYDEDPTAPGFIVYADGIACEPRWP